MHIVIGHHRLDDQSITMGVVDEVCITFFESDVVIFPFELLRMPLVHTVNISERPLLFLSDISFLCPMCFSSEVRPAEDRPDLMWGHSLKCIVLWPGPPIVDVVLEVPAMDEFLNFILECNALFSGVTDIFMVLTIFIMIPLGAISMQRVKSFEYSSLFHSHEDVLLWRDQGGVVSEFARRRSWHSQI